MTPNPTTLNFTTSNWNTARTVTAGNAADRANDNDTAQVTGVPVAAGNAQMAVSWTAVDNVTGYKVQWKSGSESYDHYSSCCARRWRHGNGRYQRMEKRS